MKPVNIAILGIGAIADKMADAIKNCEDVFPCGVASRDLRKAKLFAEKHGFLHFYGSYEEMLADKDIELVYISVPHALHCEYTLKCLEAGKNVITEKPFAVNAIQTRTMIEMAQKKKLMVAEGIWMCYLPIVENIKHICQSGIIGEVRCLSGEIGYHLTQNRLFDPVLAGGALLDIGVYAVALCGIVFGYDIMKICSNAVLTNSGIDEINSFIFSYQTGQIASFSTAITLMSSCRGTIWGSNGYADISNVNSLDEVRVFDLNRNEIERFNADPNVKNSYDYELRSVIKALREGRIDTPEAPHDEILKRINIMDRLRRKMKVNYPFES